MTSVAEVLARMGELQAAYEHALGAVLDKCRILQDENDLLRACTDVLDEEVQRLQRLVKS